MKLRNKKTGEIVDFSKGDFISSKDYGFVIYKDGGRGIKYYSLAELNEEWEDYEEGHRVYYLDYTGDVCDILSEVIHPKISLKMKRIGNYFETKEEAEKVREKIDAWKRLKDKGFKVDLWDYDGGNYQERIKTGRILFRVKDYEENDKDLDLLFGGEK